MLIIGFVIIVIFKRSSIKCKNANAVSYQLEGKRYCLMVADSRSKWVKGLMNVQKPVDYDGMIFIFPEKKIQNFWNENTFVDLYVYWLEDDRVVGKTLLPSIKKTKEPLTINSPKPVNRVIEIIK